MSDMSDDTNADDGLKSAESQALGQLLDSEAVWDEPHPGVEDAVVMAVSAEAGPLEPLTPPRPGRGERRYLAVIAAAAVVLLAVGVTIGLLAGNDDATIEVPLVGTDAAPDASALALVSNGSSGLRVVLDVRGLAPAEPGTYYQGWVRGEAGSVTIGTFHLRGGDDEVELWAGVTSDEYPGISVTLQQVGGGADSSGVVVLSGQPDP